MQRSELERKLRKAGWRIAGGAKHNKAVDPNNPNNWTTIPKGSKINDNTARAILKFAGVIE
jgi:hypothetical protein